MTSGYTTTSTTHVGSVPKWMHASSGLLHLVQTATGFLVLAAVVIAIPTPAAAQGCLSGVESDFNGDGVADLAIGDPRATVSGQESAGRVTVAFGGGGSQTITQSELAGNDNGAGDQFGFSLASTDWNGDGCSDLIVGIPFEELNADTAGQSIAVVYNAVLGSLTLYVDGVASEPIADPLFDTWTATSGLQIGRSMNGGTYGDYFSGAVDEVRAYTGALNHAAVQIIGDGTPRGARWCRAVAGAGQTWWTSFPEGEGWGQISGCSLAGSPMHRGRRESVPAGRIRCRRP